MLCFFNRLKTHKKQTKSLPATQFVSFTTSHIFFPFPKVKQLTVSTWQMLLNEPRNHSLQSIEGVCCRVNKHCNHQEVPLTASHSILCYLTLLTQHAIMSICFAALFRGNFHHLRFLLRDCLLRKTYFSGQPSR